MKSSHRRHRVTPDTRLRTCLTSLLSRVGSAKPKTCAGSRTLRALCRVSKDTYAPWLHRNEEQAAAQVGGEPSASGAVRGQQCRPLSTGAYLEIRSSCTTAAARLLEMRARPAPLTDVLASRRRPGRISEVRPRRPFRGPGPQRDYISGGSPPARGDRARRRSCAGAPGTHGTGRGTREGPPHVCAANPRAGRLHLKRGARQEAASVCRAACHPQSHDQTTPSPGATTGLATPLLALGGREGARGASSERRDAEAEDEAEGTACACGAERVPCRQRSSERGRQVDNRARHAREPGRACVRAWAHTQRGAALVLGCGPAPPYLLACLLAPSAARERAWRGVAWAQAISHVG
eukprot:scaffold3165_cov380-Prasinococcus_capsulatus_cf.AAC.4